MRCTAARLAASGASASTSRMRDARRSGLMIQIERPNASIPAFS
jgi:hypothetical protein